MMRHAVVWFILAMLFFAGALQARAQEFSFRGRDVIDLAATVVLDAQVNNQLGSSFRVQMASSGSRLLSAENVFELLARTVSTWETDGAFPTTVPLTLESLQPPVIDPKLEPKLDGDRVAVPTTDIGTYASAWLNMAKTQGRLSRDMRFGLTPESEYRLTAAQFIVAMAMLIDEAARIQRYPSAITVPRVRSPRTWLGESASLTPPADPARIRLDDRITLSIQLNGRNMSEISMQGANRVPPPLCGTMRLEIRGTGPIESMRVLLDGIEYTTLQGGGPHVVSINSTFFTDGPHMMTVSAVAGESRPPATTIFSFSIQNGREAGFTPMQTDF